MKLPNHAEKRPWSKRFASGFMAFAMGLSVIPAPAVSALTLKSDELLDSVVSAQFSTEFESESSNESQSSDTAELIPQSTDTLDTLETLPEFYPGMEGVIPNWDDEEEEAEPSHWAAEYLEKMVDFGYMRPQDATAPDELLTRAEFMSVINRAYGYEEMGDMPFTDVLETDWYYDDVAIATNAGFVSGTSETTAEPLANMTRETTAFILGKNLMLPEIPGENLLFDDSRDISDWSRSLVKSASVYGLMSGYDDNTFRPLDYITRAEISALVMKAVGTPILTAGDVTLSEVFGNVTITESGTVLKDTIIAGDLHISNGIALGGVVLENVVVLGRIVVSGGESNEGDASIILRNVVSSELVIDNMANNKVTVRIEGNSYIENTYARTNSYIEDNTTSENGLRTITIDSEPGVTIDFAGRIKEVVNTSPNTTVRVVNGSVDVMTIDETATEVMTEVLMNAVINQLNIDVATNVSGEGDIGSVNVNASDVVIEQLPDDIIIRPGVDANINGENMDSNLAEEYSSEPRILAGYPIASDIAPSSFDAVFSTNKPGTIYWSISNVSAGSVPESELLAPPSYGATGFLNGSLYVIEGEQEDVVFIEELPVGGSYYLTAILEDSKGALSPIKVISFSTPDNTIPEFAEGYPYISFVGNDSAQVTVMATKSCKLYYAVLQAGAVVPTPEDFLSGAISGAEGYGIQDMTKNKEGTFTVATGLMEQKDFVVYLWLTDADNANYSEVVGLEFTTTDGTPPIFNQVPTYTNIGTNSADFSFSLNENGTVYYIAVPAGTTYPTVMPGDTSGNLTEPWDSDYAKMQVANGLSSGVSFSGSVAAVENQNGTFSLTGLALETAYDLYYVAMDTAGNYSDYIGMTTFNTIDNTPPTFIEQTFSHTASSNLDDVVAQPYATTNITLVFSEGIQSTYFEGSTGQSFLQLYTAVITATTNDAEITARNNLAAALENCFSFYTWNGNTPTAVTVRDATNANDPDVYYDGDWVIDYRYVTIQFTGGLMYVNFPTITSEGSGGQHRPTSALNLSSGVTYGFKLHNIQDSSFDANVMVPAEMTLDKFTTIFAEIMLGPASTMGNLPIARDENGLQTGNYAVMDNDMRITPGDMSNVDEDIVYEIRFNPNTLVSFNIYYRIVDEKGVHNPDVLQYYPEFPDLTYLKTDAVQADRITRVQNAWTPDTNGWIYLNMDYVSETYNDKYTTNPTALQGGNGTGVGFNYGFLGYQGLTSYPSLAALSTGYQIEMVFEVTSYQGSTERGEWNGLLEIDTYIYAGSYNSVRYLGPVGNPSADVYNSVSLVSSPGDYVVDANFTDSIPPAMGPGAPMAITQDISATLKVSFDGTRTGTLYYAVVRSNSPDNLGPTFADTGGNVKSEDIPDINEIYFTDADFWPMFDPPVLGSPIYLGVTTYIDSENKTLYGSIPDLDKTAVNIYLEDLLPLTEYYVYLVSISDHGGGFSDPWLYKFTTTDTERPKYQNLKAESTDASVSWTTHVDANLDWLMMTSSDATRYLTILNTPFYEYLLENPGERSTVLKTGSTTEYYTFIELYQFSPYWINRDSLIYTDGVTTAPADANPYTVLDLLSLSYSEAGNYDHPEFSSTGYTGFDVFASNTMKDEMNDAIKGQNQGIVANGSGEVDMNELMTVYRDAASGVNPDASFVFFVTGSNVNADQTDPASLINSFRVLKDFTISDLVAPHLTTSTAGITASTNSGDNQTLATLFDGSIGLVFDKYLYAKQQIPEDLLFLNVNNVDPSKDAWAGNVAQFTKFWYTGLGSLASAPDSTITVRPSTLPDVPVNALNFDFTQISDGATIEMFSGGQIQIANKNGVTRDSPNGNLVLTFKTQEKIRSTTTNDDSSVTTITDLYAWWYSNWDSDWGSTWNEYSGTIPTYAKLVDSVTITTGGSTLIAEPDTITLTPTGADTGTVSGKSEVSIGSNLGTFSLGAIEPPELIPYVSLAGRYLTVTLPNNYSGPGGSVTINHSSGQSVSITVTVASTTALSTMSLMDTYGSAAVTDLSDETDLVGGTYTLISDSTGIDGVTATINERTGRLSVDAGRYAKTGKGSVMVQHSSGAVFEVPIEVVDGASVSLSETSMSIMVGEKKSLTATTKNQGSEKLTWSVTSGSASGLGFTASSSKIQYFTPTKAGTYTITATLSNGSKASCTITVKESSAQITMPAGETLKESTVSGYDYEWDVRSAGAKNLQITSPLNKYKFTVSSSDTSVASIYDPSFATTLGYKPVTITVKEKGETTISIKNNNDGKTVKILVTYD